MLEIAVSSMKGDGPIKSRRIDYKMEDDYFYGARFIFECGYKLKGNPLTIATAANIYHRFFREVEFTTYDKYLIAAAALYIAGKISDDYKLRDVINVAHYTLHKTILDLKDEYWIRRDALLQAELLVMRVLKFKADPPQAHAYLLHYLRSIGHWVDREAWEKVPVPQSSLAFLQDLHHNPEVLDSGPQDIALACIYVTLQAYGMEVAPKEDWYTTLYKDANISPIIDILFDMYNKAELPSWAIKRNLIELEEQSSRQNPFESDLEAGLNLNPPMRSNLDMDFKLPSWAVKRNLIELEEQSSRQNPFESDLEAGLNLNPPMRSNLDMDFS